MRAWIALAVFAAASLAAILAGCAVAVSFDVPTAVWVRPLMAWAGGAALAFGLVRFRLPPRSRALLLLAGLAAMASTLIGPGQMDVHRWIQIGPLHLNAAALLLPSVIVSLGVQTLPWRWTIVVLGLISALLLAQPDASQATAFLAAAVVLLVPVGIPVAARVAVIGGLAGATAITWMRPDPLAPVPEVELILSLAFDLSPALALAIGAAIGLAALAPLLLARTWEGSESATATALAAYFVACGLAPAFGAFPVPLAGMSMSPIIGAWIGMGLLANAATRQATARQQA